MQQWIGKKRKSKIWDCMQLAGEKTPPFSASVNQIFKDNEVIDVTGAILSREIRQQPNQSNVKTEKEHIKKENLLT